MKRKGPEAGDIVAVWYKLPIRSTSNYVELPPTSSLGELLKLIVAKEKIESIPFGLITLKIGSSHDLTISDSIMTIIEKGACPLMPLLVSWEGCEKDSLKYKQFETEYNVATLKEFSNHYQKFEPILVKLCKNWEGEKDDPDSLSALSISIQQIRLLIVPKVDKHLRPNISFSEFIEKVADFLCEFSEKLIACKDRVTRRRLGRYAMIIVEVSLPKLFKELLIYGVDSPQWAISVTHIGSFFAKDPCIDEPDDLTILQFLIKASLKRIVRLTYPEAFRHLVENIALSEASIRGYNQVLADAGMHDGNSSKFLKEIFASFWGMKI